MKATKEYNKFLDWFELKYSKEWVVTEVTISNGCPASEVFESFPFEFTEGVYRSYFREKGIGIDIEHHRVSLSQAKVTIMYKGIGHHYPKDSIQTKLISTYPEAFEALITKLFENDK